MSSKTKQLLIALIIGVLALIGNQWYLSSQIEAARPRSFEKVVRAKRAIKADEPLQQGMYEVREIPKPYIPRAAVRAGRIGEFLGQRFSVPVSAEDYILESHFSAEAMIGTKLSAQVPKENAARAITIPVDEVNSLSRSIVTGDKIDMLYTFSAPGVAGKISVMFLQNVPVISTGSYSVAEAEMGERGTGTKRYGTVTLLLGVRDAARLNYARQSGQISILLRSDKDDAAADLPAITGVKDLLSASDRTLVEDAARRSGISTDTAEQLKEQFRQMLETQRTQQKR